MTNFIHKTTLRFANNEVSRHATWLEIFFDLIFAVIVIRISDRMMDDLTLIGILQSIALFIPVMWTWNSYTVFAARFDNNDVIYWLLTFVIMFAAIIMAIQIPSALESGTFGFAIGFLIGQVSLLILYARNIFAHQLSKQITLFYLLGFGLGGISWFVSLFFSSPLNFIFWILGMVIYLMTPWVGRKKILSKVPLDTSYIPERFGSFIVIIVGQTITSVVFGVSSAHWNISSILTGIMAFILAIIFWGKYYRMTQIADFKCNLGSGQPYIYAHIPLITSLMIIGVCVENIIKASSQITADGMEDINLYFCFAIILYLSSFYLLQILTLKKMKLRSVIYICGIATIMMLFLFFKSPLVLMTSLVAIFIILFDLQYWIGLHNS